VPPVIAIKLFEPQFDNDPIILQYAHRVLAQHPVDVMFFYVPQIVQALRNDAYGKSTEFLGVDILIGVYRLRGKVYFRNGQDFATILSPNHLEHESELLQR
jgi:hypothetical protein